MDQPKPTRTATQVNSTCNRCKLHEQCNPKSVGLRGYNTGDQKKLAIFTDAPDYFADRAQRPYSLDVKRMLDWLLARMSVDPKDVAYEYTLRCYGGEDGIPTTKAGRAEVIEACSMYRFASVKRLKPRSIVVAGQASFEAFTGGGKVGDNEGRKHRAWEGVVRDYCEGVWCSYSINYILTSPSDTPRVFRTIYRAAEEAGLNPKLDPTVPPYQWRNLK